MSFTVVYDANVLFPAPLRDLLIRLAMTGLFRARWTEDILDEVFRNILKQRPDLIASRLERTRQIMNRAVRDVLVDGYQPLIEGLSLPDPDDRHVLAAAVKSGAQAVVTFNLKDFPSSVLANHDVEAVHPDVFVLDLLDLAPGAVLQVLNEQQLALKNPPRSLADLLTTLENNGLVRSMAEVRASLGA